MTARRFSPPWIVEELNACFVVRDHNDQALAYVNFEDEQGAAVDNTALPVFRQENAVTQRRFPPRGLSNSSALPRC